MSAAVPILVIDDNKILLETTALFLTEEGFETVACQSGEEGIKQLGRKNFAAVLTDIKMPGMSGLAVLQKTRAINKNIPVILMTAYAELDMAVEALKNGAFDFIIKPFKPEYLVISIKKAIEYTRLVALAENYTHMLEEDVGKRTKELAEALKTVKNLSNEITYRLTSVAEFRDTETGLHIKRMGFYCVKLAEALGLGADFAEAMRFASPMHDIGKIGIPDNILLKPGPLTTEEFSIIKNHTVIGHKILANSTYPALQTAAVIALTHHERWDGTGYPGGLKGKEIPPEGRILIIPDQYDALRGKRPYKNPLGHAETCEIILKGDKRTMPEHFDPEVLNAFSKITDAFEEIFEEY